MKVYLAGTAPGNDTISESVRERGILNTPRRLLSYYYIVGKNMQNHIVFEIIKKEKQHESQQNRTSKRFRKGEAWSSAEGDH